MGIIVTSEGIDIIIVIIVIISSHITTPIIIIIIITYTFPEGSWNVLGTYTSCPRYGMRRCADYPSHGSFFASGEERERERERQVGYLLYAGRVGFLGGNRLGSWWVQHEWIEWEVLRVAIIQFIIMVIFFGVGENVKTAVTQIFLGLIFFVPVVFIHCFRFLSKRFNIRRIWYTSAPSLSINLVVAVNISVASLPKSI